MFTANFMYLIMKVELGVFNLNNCVSVHLYVYLYFQGPLNFKAIIAFVCARFWFLSGVLVKFQALCCVKQYRLVNSSGRFGGT
jgi:hypothetical protein